MADASLDRRVDAARRFNRFYTCHIGVLNEEAGFKLVARAPTSNFGRDLISETWELRLLS